MNEFRLFVRGINYALKYGRKEGATVGMGVNADGEWVNFANNCVKCGHHMPLPRCNKTYCPECGTYCFVPSRSEAKEIARREKRECHRCGYLNAPEANFCIICGINIADARWK